MDRPIESHWQSFGIAVVLALVLMLGTFGQSLATFLIRMHQSDIMLGAVTNITVTSRATLDLIAFSGGVLLVHLLFACVVFLLAHLSSVAFPAQRATELGWTVAWFAVLLAVVLLQNAEWFTRSHSGAYYHRIATSEIGPLTVVRWVELFAGLAATMIVAVAVARRFRQTVRGLSLKRFGLFASASMVLIGVTASMFGPARFSNAVAAHAMPNVVVLGVDSLRLQEIGRFGGRGSTPALDVLLADANLFRDTTTPLARTFPSWMAILTGRSPRATGANFNLVHREAVDAAPTLPDLLHAKGYETVFATDEVRFSNIDESYGFDTVVTPPIGAADFLIGRTADMPLTNVLANSALGSLVLPYLHGNRAVADLYRPATFINLLDRKFNPKGPSFLAVHLTAAHWPYYHAGTAEGGAEFDSLDRIYHHGLATADSMVGEVIELLQRKGILDNAILVILSDHGEALMLPGDSLVAETVDGRIAGLKSPVRSLIWGHGQSVLSPVQYQVLLAFKLTGQFRGYVSNGRTISAPASLEDVVPTVMELLRLKSPPVDGRSLAGLFGNGPNSSGESRVRFTETDVRVAPSADGHIDEDALAAQAARLFAVDHETGWLHLRPNRMPTLMMYKERAAIGHTQVLAALPVAPRQHQYVLVDRNTGEGRVLVQRPDESEGEGAVLWDSLHRHFGDELMLPVVVGEGQQAKFDAQWVELEKQDISRGAAAG